MYFNMYHFSFLFLKCISGTCQVKTTTLSTPFAYYTWTQPSNGLFDIYIMFDSPLTSWFSFIALYNSGKSKKRKKKKKKRMKERRKEGRQKGEEDREKDAKREAERLIYSLQG